MSNNDTKKPLTVKVLNDKVIRIQSTGYDSINESSLDKMTSKLDKMNIKDGEKEKEKLIEIYNNNGNKQDSSKEEKGQGQGQEENKKLNLNPNAKTFIPKNKVILDNTNNVPTNNMINNNNSMNPINKGNFFMNNNSNTNMNMTNFSNNMNLNNMNNVNNISNMSNLNNFIPYNTNNQGFGGFNNNMNNNNTYYNHYNTGNPQNMNYKNLNYNNMFQPNINNVKKELIPLNTLNTESKPYKPNVKGTINTINHGHGPDSLAETPVKHDENQGNKFSFENVNKNKDSGNKDKDSTKEFNLTNEENKKEFSLPSNNEGNNNTDKIGTSGNAKKPSKLDSFLKEPNLTVSVKANNPVFIQQKNNEKNSEFMKELNKNSKLEQEIKRQKEKEENEKKEKLKESQSKTKNEKPMPKIITEKIYMTFTEGEQPRTNKMFVDYMVIINKFKGCSKTDLLPKECIEHFTLMEKKVDKIVKNTYADNRESTFQKGSKFSDKHDEKESSFNKSSKFDNLMGSNDNKGLNKWAKLDLSKHNEEAENTRKMMTIAREEDPIKDEIMFFLNKLTVDKYKEVFEGISEVLKNDIDRQAKFISLVFKKAVSSITYAHLFAKLCNDLKDDLDPKEPKDSKEKEDDQNEENKDKDKKPTFKSQLQDYSKNRIMHKFVPDENIIDREERYNVLKKEIHGIFNFITELVISKILQRKFFNNLIKHAFSKLSDQDYLEFTSLDYNISSIYMECIIQSVENFGTIINQPESKIKAEPLKEININISEYIKSIGEMLESNESLPGYLKYLHLNLVEKTKNKWELTEVDKIKRAKGQKELEEASRHLKSNDFNQDDITTKIKEDLYIWKSCRDENHDPKQYPFTITTDLFQKRGCKLVNILKSLRYLSIDAVNNKTSAHDYAVYFYEHCYYYFKYEDKNQIAALKNEFLDILTNLNDLMLDNMLLSLFYGELLFSMVITGLMKMSDLDSLCDISDDSQLSSIVEAIYYSTKSPTKTDDGKKNIKPALLETKFFAKFKDYFSKFSDF